MSAMDTQTEQGLELRADDPAGAVLRSAISSVTSDFLAEQRTALAGIDPDLDVLVELAETLTAGGKRLRPALCVWGFVAAGGPLAEQLPDREAQQSLFRVAASLDLLHVSALVHDDVMDGSDLRRGAPAAHRRLEAWHREHDRAGDPETFGRAGAILLGDLLLMWSAELLQRSGFDPGRLSAALPIVETMRTEVTCGQYLDVLTQTARVIDTPSALQDELARAEQVTEYKSARYTVVRPAQLGARLAGADDVTLDRLAAFGSPLGRAFQYRDDLLGVFGDAAVTGKPAGDDLREGKRTVLIAHARAGTDDAGRRLLDERLGSPDLDAAGVAELQQLILDSGAVEAVEQMIAADRDLALTALDTADPADPADQISPDGHTALAALVGLAVDRTF